MADTKISALSEKETLAANDITNILDSAASNADKRVKLSAIKTFTDSDVVKSINSETPTAGDVTLTTDEITEGETNLYDQTVSFTGGTNITIGGTYPSFEITDNSGTGTSDYADPITTKGDFVVGGSDGASVRFAVGTDDYVLTADSSAATGVKWAAAGAGGGIGEFNGTEALTVSGTDALGIGIATASGDNSIAISPGGGGTATEAGSISIGYNSDATNQTALAIGYECVASGIGALAIAGYSSSASGLRSISIGVSSNSTQEDSIAIGKSAGATGVNAIAIGESAAASGAPSVAIGLSATVSAQDGVAIGKEAYVQANYGIAIGNSANAVAANSIGIGIRAFGNVINSIGLGAYSVAERYGELAVAIEKATTPNRNMGIVGYHKDTTDDTEIEMFLNGVSNQRLTLYDTDQVISFDGKVIVADYTNNKSAKWTINGLIVRHGGTTAFVGTPSVTQDFYDAGMDSCAVAVVADDTNDALAIKVTGLAATTLRWTARLDIVEDIDR